MSRVDYLRLVLAIRRQLLRRLLRPVIFLHPVQQALSALLRFSEPAKLVIDQLERSHLFLAQRANPYMLIDSGGQANSLVRQSVKGYNIADFLNGEMRHWRFSSLII